MESRSLVMDFFMRCKLLQWQDVAAPDFVTREKLILLVTFRGELQAPGLFLTIGHYSTAAFLSHAAL